MRPSGANALACDAYAGGRAGSADAGRSRVLSWKTIALAFLALIVLAIALSIAAVILWSTGGGKPNRSPVQTAPAQRSP